tara:strand:- start:801 stop:1304 length:504 start_codon:yes stop_codon:yes gene_type:complete
MSTDFEIRERALELMNRLSENFGEVTEEDDAELTAILDEVESPMAYLFFMQKKCEANAAECKELADIYTVRRGSWNKRRERFKARMLSLLQAMEELGEDPKHSGHWGTASLTSSSRAVVTDVGDLPEQFVKTTKSAIKTEILKALRSGSTIEGAHLETSRNLSIRSK